MSVKLRKKKITKGRVSLYLDVYVNGRRQYEFLQLYLGKDRQQNKDVLTLATNIRDKRALDLAHAQHGQVAPFRRKVDFIDYFEQLCQGRQRTWKNALNYLRAFAGGSLPFSAISAEWLETFKAYLLSQVKANTGHVYFAHIKTALRLAEGKIIDRSPAAHVSQIKPTETPRSFLTLEEIEKLAATECGDAEVKRAFLFSCFTGLRLSDVEALKWEYIEGNRLQFRQKKTGSFEYTPLSETAQEILSGPDNVRPLPSNHVFALRSRTHIARVLKEWVTAAGLGDKKPPITFHSGRHTYATLALSSGGDLFVISKLLGHSSITVTQAYTKIIDRRKEETVSLLPRLKAKGSK